MAHSTPNETITTGSADVSSLHILCRSLCIEAWQKTLDPGRKTPDLGKTKVAANETIILDGIEGKSIEIKAEVDPGSASECGFDVFRSDDGIEKTRISFIRTKTRFNPSDTLQIDISGSILDEDKISSPPESGPFILEETETLKLRIFIDRSIVEVFANDKQCLTIRSYPTLQTSKKVAFFSLNGSSELISLEKWNMQSIWPELNYLEGN